MDLSKAFDCLPHGLRLLKLKKYYGLSENTETNQIYLTNRKQSVKLRPLKVINLKGAPQGSILVPVLFNILIES